MARQIVLKLTAITVLAAVLGAATASAQSSAGQITVLYDAFGKTSTMTKDWDLQPSSSMAAAYLVRHWQQCRDFRAQCRGQGC